MIIYFADRQMNILGTASTALMKGLTVAEDLKTEDLETGVATFSCKIPFSKATRGIAESCVNAGNYVLRSDGEDKEFYTIIETEVDTENGDIYLYAEDAGLDLLNEVALEYAADKAYSLSYYVEKWIHDSGFEIGINEVEGVTKKLAWNSESSVTERLRDIAAQFGDCEISFSFDISRLAVTHKYVNIYKKRGKDLGIQLRLNQDINKIITKKSIANLATSLLCTGAAPEGSDIPVTLEGYKYDDGDFYVSGRRLNSRNAAARWSRYIWKDEPGQLDGYTGHIIKPFHYETVSQEELCKQAVAELKKICDIEANYEVDLASLPDSVKIGDRVNIVDDDGELYLSARILKLEISVADNNRTATLGEYLIKDSGISQKVQELASQFGELAKSRVFYTWFAYADDEYGTNISLYSGGKAYLGVLANQTTEEPDLSDPTRYTWTKIKGADGGRGPVGPQGEKGDQGPQGVDGETSYTHIAYANSADGQIDFSLSDSNRSYIGLYVDFIAFDSINPSDYLWSLIKGDRGLQGLQGPEGKQGIPGTAGVDGKSSYFHIKYSAVETPTASQMTETPSEFIGTYVDDIETDSADPKKYTWSRFQGIQGDKGENGIPGTNGTDGQTSYLHIKYSNDGGTTFTANNGESPGDYIGVRTDFVQADSINVKDYVWSQTKGEKGDKGERGLQGLQGEKGDQGIQGPKGIDGKTSYTHIAYANNSDGTKDFSVSDSSREYVGMYVDFVAADSTNPSMYAWSKIKGADGTQGTPGKAGADGKTPYLHIAYANSADGKTGFSVSVSANKLYIGQYTDYTSADSTDPTKYAWTKIKGDTGATGPQGPQGATGPQGVQGPKGADGKQLYTWLKYADTPTSGMSDNPTGKAYIGLAYNKTTATESSNYGDYTWSLVKGEKGDQGVAGGKGSDGKTLYTWVKYATSASGANMSDSPSGKTYIGLAYNKATVAESTNAADYTWSLIKGEKGDTGAQGPQGPKGTTGNTGAAGTPARTYMVESLVSLVKKSIVDQLTPASLTFNSYYRDGNGAVKTAYTGKLVVSESTNGSTFVDKTTVASGNAITHKITSASVTHIKCTLYSGTTALAATTVMVVADSDAIALQWCHSEKKVLIDGGKIYVDQQFANKIFAKQAQIGGFNIGSTYLANNTTALAGAANSVYLGTNGISCGRDFSVSNTGELYASSIFTMIPGSGSFMGFDGGGLSIGLEEVIGTGKNMPVCFNIHYDKVAQTGSIYMSNEYGEVDIFGADGVIINGVDMSLDDETIDLWTSIVRSEGGVG